MVKLIDINRIDAAPYNPRVQLMPGMPDYEKLKSSIEQFGCVEPLVWNKVTCNLVGGHQRLTVMRDLGYKEVPCMVVELDEEDEKVLNVALNKIKGEWDYEKLEELLSELESETRALTGFAEEEIAVILASNADLLDDDDDSLDDWDDEWAEEQEANDNHVITLQFDDFYLAERWAESKGLQTHLHEGTATTVIRMEGGEWAN